MKKTKCIYLALISVLLSPMAANATLIGDTIGCQTSSSPWSCSTPTAVVGAGAEFTLDLFTSASTFTVDFSDAAIDFSVTIGVGNIEGLGPVTFSDLDWVGMAGEIVGFSITAASIPGMDASRIFFTGDSMSFNFDGLSTSESQVFSVALDVSHDSVSVPVPATLALFGLGLAGLGWSRRKKA